MQRANDFADRQHSTGAQLISTIGSSMLNELRVQYATRAQSRVPNALSGTGPAINVTGVANFGGSVARIADVGFGFTQNVFQVNNSTTLLRGNHGFKAGLDLQFVADTRTSGQAQLYTFPNAAAYLAARDGTQPPRLHQLHAVLRPARPRVQHQAVRVVRAGRLARRRRT